MKALGPQGSDSGKRYDFPTGRYSMQTRGDLGLSLFRFVHFVATVRAKQSGD